MNTGASTQRRIPKEPVSHRLGRFSALILGLFFFILFSATNADLFLTQTTFRTTLSQGVVTLIVSLAFLIPLTAGVFDLTVGSMMALSLVTVTYLNLNTDTPLALCCLIAVALCCCVGFVNGVLIVRFRVNSLIATLGMSQVLLAANLKISDNREILGSFPPGFQDLGNTTFLGLPKPLYILLALAVVIWFVLEHTPAGRYLFALGFNPEAARLAGVSTTRLTYGSLIASAAVASIAGIVYSMQIGVYSAGAGVNMLFPALAAVFFGASQFSGRPNVWGTVVAYFVLAFGVKGLELEFGAGTFWIKPLFEGLALLIAVSLASRQSIRARNRKVETDASPAPPDAPVDDPPSAKAVSAERA